MPCQSAKRASVRPSSGSSWIVVPRRIGEEPAPSSFRPFRLLLEPNEDLANEFGDLPYDGLLPCVLLDRPQVLAVEIDEPVGLQVETERHWRPRGECRVDAPAIRWIGSAVPVKRQQCDDLPLRPLAPSVTLLLELAADLEERAHLVVSGTVAGGKRLPPEEPSLGRRSDFNEVVLGGEVPRCIVDAYLFEATERQDGKRDWIVERREPIKIGRRRPIGIRRMAELKGGGVVGFRVQRRTLFVPLR